MTCKPSQNHAVVCIPTFKRPNELKRTLQSAVDQITDFSFAIVVVDNDGLDPVGAGVAEEFLAKTGISHKVIVERNQGNCFAINTAFSTALKTFTSAEFVLMIDDDETADPNWLAHMVMTATQNNADIVGGPVDRIFPDNTAKAISEHALFGSLGGQTRQVETIHGSGNCLLRRSVFDALEHPKFDIRFNFLGGGDMEFFTRCRRAGLKFWWCNEAKISEYVTPDRVSGKWLMQRSIRTGCINFMIDRVRAKTPLDLVMIFAKNFVSLGLGVLRSLGLIIKFKRLLPATHPVLMSLGRVLAGIGVIPTPYKAE